ncbi:MAG: hypothetical protein EG828_04480, partial [Deltaproteobacteria bacterium]|nr:hypothetical protein [Deltaproteobacteria bacterium]
MDVAQSSACAVMPGAAALSTPPELPVGASAASPLFREMFAKAALAAETPGTLPGKGSVPQQAATSNVVSSGRLQMGGKEAVLSSQGLALTGDGSVSKHAVPEMTGDPEVVSGNHGARMMVFRQLTEEIARTPGPREFSLEKKRENSAGVKGARAEVQQEAELVTDSEQLLAGDHSVR